jgi:uncharacterized protein YndB with AHSA1/START domain
MKLKFQVQIKIQKPVDDVFDAVYDPEKLSGYFTNGGATGKLDAGTTPEWAFADTPGEEFRFPVVVEETIPNELIVLRWQGTREELNRVEMRFESTGEEETLVQISESGWTVSQEDLDRSYGNCMGWSQMLSALKAYVEYGINLRKGAYTGLCSAKDKEARSA